MSQAAHLDDKTIKRFEEVITIEVVMACTLGEVEGHMIETGYMKVLLG